MLIGLDASRAVVAQRTGTEHYAYHLIRALTRLGAEHRFRLYFNQPPEDGVFERSERVEWCVMPMARLWTHVRLAAELALHPPDILFVPSHVVPLVHPRRCVATVHDLGYLHYPEAHTGFSRRYLDWSTRHNARVCDRVLADSEATRRDLRDAYGVPDIKIVTAYPAGAENMAPVASGPARKAVLERYGLGEQYVLYLGTLQPRKNLLGLLTVFESLVTQGRVASNVQLVLAGRHGWLYDEILTRSVHGVLKGRVLLPGYVPQEDVPALMSGAGAFVLPSFWEGFGLPVLEAMACQTPVICSNVSSLPEVAGDAALLVDPHDPEALADALARVLDDQDLRRELIDRGKHQVQQFSWGKCAQTVLNVLEDVASGR